MLPPATTPHYFSDSGDLDAIHCTMYLCVVIGVLCVISNKVAKDFDAQPSLRDME